MRFLGLLDQAIACNFKPDSPFFSKGVSSFFVLCFRSSLAATAVFLSPFPMEIFFCSAFDLGWLFSGILFGVFGGTSISSYCKGILLVVFLTGADGVFVTSLPRSGKCIVSGETFLIEGWFWFRKNHPTPAVIMTAKHT